MTRRWDELLLSPRIPQLRYTWERLLTEFCTVLLAELRLVSAEERLGVAALWAPLHGRACAVALELDAAYNELHHIARIERRGGAAPLASDEALLGIPSPKLVFALTRGSDTANTFLERLPALRYLVSACRGQGLFGNDEGDVEAWLGLHEALRLREAELAPRASLVGLGRGAPSS